jgi:hypothetical protein
MARPHEVVHGWMHGNVFELLADVEGSRYTGRWDDKGPIEEAVPLPKGTRVKVVSVSRFANCGITPDLNAEHGNVACVDPAILKLADREETDDERRRKALGHEDWEANQQRVRDLVASKG